MHIADPSKKPADIYLYTLQPARLEMLTAGPTQEEASLAARHWVYSQDLLKKGMVIFAGRTLVTTADTFAVCVIQAGSVAEAEAVMNGDPAVEGGLFRARLFPFQPMLMGAWPMEA